MMMRDNKKNVASLIVAKMASPKSDEKLVSSEKDGAEQEYSAHSMAAEEILSAMKASDAKQLSEALKSFVEMCMNEYESSEEEKED